MESTEEKAENIKEIPLAQLGLKLPIGLRRGEEFHRDFTVRPWRMLEEKMLAKAKKDAPGQNLATYVATVVGFMCPQLGHHVHDPKDASDKELAERRVYISQMYMCDVWYAYAFIRRDALGDELKLKITCPRCRKGMPWVGSLATLGVRVPDNLDATLWAYKLHNPIKLRGKDVEQFRLGPQTWSVAEAIHANPDEGMAKESAIRASIYHLNDEAERTTLAPGDLDLLTKRDIEGLSAEIDRHFVGPNMAIELGAETPCPNPKCGFSEPRLVPIDWSFDSFFGVSSH